MEAKKKAAHARTHTHMHAHTHARTHTHKHARTHARARARAHTHARTHTHTRTHEHARKYMHARTRAHTHTHTLQTGYCSRLSCSIHFTAGARGVVGEPGGGEGGAVTRDQLREINPISKYGALERTEQRGKEEKRGRRTPMKNPPEEF